MWAALAEHVKGKVYAPKASCSWGEPLPPRWALDHVVLVASYVDAVKSAPRSYVLVSHGADQRYAGDPRTARNPSYAGGDGHDRCILFLTPNQASADAWAARYPGTPAVAVGVPKLDSVHARLA